jgi:hypothetical protein
MHNEFLFFLFGILSREKNGNLYQIWSWINKTWGKLLRELWDQYFQCFILIFPLWNREIFLFYFPFYNTPFHVYIREIQVFIDGPTWNHNVFFFFFLLWDSQKHYKDLHFILTFIFSLSPNLAKSSRVMDDHHFSYITKLKKNKNLKQPWYYYY